MKALIAMSGGVDSAVAALLMQRAGFTCVGATIVNHLADGSTTCPPEEVLGAEDTARRLGIPLHILDFSAEFDRYVVDRFVETYRRGHTPNPCLDCNQYIKFGRLLEAAGDLGCDCIATGHYARTAESGGRFLLKKGLDEQKDQSYMLYRLSQEQLRHVYLPLGGLSKAEVRRLAAEAGFLNAAKAESQDICFIPDGDYAGFILRRCGESCSGGAFVDESGTVLGQHKGIIHYTVGQRRGLGVSACHPLYVKKLDAEKNQVVLTANEGLFQRTARADRFNWIQPPGADTVPCAARARYHQKEQPAEAQLCPDGTVRITFRQPQRALTPGQAIVLYRGEDVLGGGTIIAAED